MVSGEYFWLPHFYKDLNLLFTLTEACFHVSVLILAVLFYNFAFYDIFAFLQVSHCEMQHGPKCTSLQISLVKARIHDRNLEIVTNLDIHHFSGSWTTWKLIMAAAAQ